MASSSKEYAHKIMKSFVEHAYDLRRLNTFEEAVHRLYGREFGVTIDGTKRMQFTCKICKKNMSGEISMADHSKSVVHLKNLDKWNRRHGNVGVNSQAQSYPKRSLQFQLLTSNIQPVGLQMVEEYRSSKGIFYYKCILCQAHGKLDVMYHHIIGQKHTDNYIKSTCVLENPVFTQNEREEIRKKLVESEGINAEAIKTIKGDRYFPYKWAEEGYASKMYGRMARNKQRCFMHASDPGPSAVSESSSLSSYSGDDDDDDDTTTGVSDKGVPSSISNVEMEAICASQIAMGAVALPGPSTHNFPPPSSRAFSKDEGSQTSVDLKLEMLKEHCNYVINNESSFTGDCDLQSCEEVIDAMHSISGALRQLTLIGLSETASFLSSNRRNILQHQEKVIQKIQLYLTKRYWPTYQVLLKESQQKKQT